MQDPKTCLLEWNPPLHPHWPRTVLFLAPFQVGQPKRGTATSAFLVSNPLKRQTSFLCTGSATFCCVFFFFFPLNLPVTMSNYSQTSSPCFYFRGVHHLRPVCNKHVYVKSTISDGRCRYHLVPGCSLSVLSRRCCLYLKHGSCSLWLPYYTCLWSCRHEDLYAWSKGEMSLISQGWVLQVENDADFVWFY